MASARSQESGKSDVLVRLDSGAMELVRGMCPHMRRAMSVADGAHSAKQVRNWRQGSSGFCLKGLSRVERL
eukprot:1025283-Rhodomonas_salina.3